MRAFDLYVSGYRSMCRVYSRSSSTFAGPMIATPASGSLVTTSVAAHERRCSCADESARLSRSAADSATLAEPSEIRTDGHRAAHRDKLYEVPGPNGRLH